MECHVEQETVTHLVEEIFEEKFGDYISRCLSEHEPEYERFGMIERLIRLEEKLKAQREIMVARFEAVDKRFEDLIHYMDRRLSHLTWLISSVFGLWLC